MPLEDISEPNAKWGICGFTSALGAVYDRGILKTEIDTAVSKDQLKTRILAEIKTYLVMLRADGRGDLIKDIEDFTQTFGGKWANFSVPVYIQTINKIAATGVVGKNDPSIAMTPDAVVDYLKRMCRVSTAKLEWTSVPRDKVIVGMGVKDTNSKWGGVKHWIYKHSGDTIYNWGAVGSLKAYMTSKGHTVLCQITL